MPFNLPDTGVLLAIDLGQKVCGFAVTDRFQSIAFPLSEFSYEEDEALWQHLKQLIQDKNISAILLGYPVSIQSKKKFIHEWIHNKAEEMKSRFALPLDFWDESLSSQEAHARKLKKGLRVDSDAALIFLQKYLESRHGFGFHEL